eukprot:TRINITY_DN13957_c0_g1_i1.p1 TRINITY_DN13957_c0_g1~~TRINITY_DN13957_c0_g1_i1.p1  ORF type:complete len:510 (-),score=68.25 TRINITY_DN13957_c0_g1_i1:42-1571(-)
MPNCPVCTRAVFSHQGITIKSISYHKNCLQCSVCAQRLTLSNYHSDKGLLFCAAHKPTFKPSGSSRTFVEHNSINRGSSASQLLSFLINNDSKNLEANLASRHLNPNGADPQSGKSYLMLSLESQNQVWATEILLRHGANPNLSTPKGYTALQYVALNRQGESQLLNLVLEHGGDPNLPLQSTGESLLHILVKSEGWNSDSLSVLLSRGANPNAVTQDGSSPLHLVRSDHGKTRVLLDHSADPNSVNNDGDTPLHLAAANKHLLIVQALLEKGARRVILNKKGLAPFHEFCSNSNLTFPELIEHLPLWASCGLDINLRTKKNETVLHFAKNLDLIDLLIISGADVNVRDDKGSTPLHECSNCEMNGYAFKTEKLLDAGADVDALDHKGTTALHLAVQSKNIRMVEALIRKGANPTIQDHKGKTARDYLKLYPGYPNNIILAQLLIAEAGVLRKKLWEVYSNSEKRSESLLYHFPAGLFQMIVLFSIDDHSPVSAYASAIEAYRIDRENR